LLKVARRYDRQIDFTIDHANACTAASRAALIDDGKEPPRRVGTSAAFAAARQDLFVLTNFGLDARPFAQNFSLENLLSRKPKWLRGGRQRDFRRNGLTGRS
jgi:hypothetical protein